MPAAPSANPQHQDNEAGGRPGGEAIARAATGDRWREQGTVRHVGGHDEEPIDNPLAEPASEHLANRESAEEPGDDPVPPAVGPQRQFNPQQGHRQPGRELRPHRAAVGVVIQETVRR